MSKQGKGFASKALSEAERIAKDELHCSIITLNTLPAKYLSDPNWWASQGYKQPKSVPVYELVLASTWVGLRFPSHMI